MVSHLSPAKFSIFFTFGSTAPFPCFEHAEKVVCDDERAIRRGVADFGAIWRELAGWLVAAGGAVGKG